MPPLEYIFHIWDVLYDKKQDTQSTIEKFFHADYTQCINGVVMDRAEYIDHVAAQKKNIESITFKYKNYLSHENALFVIYDAKGKNIEGNPIEAEVIAYFEFKDNMVSRIHGQVHLLKGTPSDVAMND